MKITFTVLCVYFTSVSHIFFYLYIWLLCCANIFSLYCAAPDRTFVSETACFKHPKVMFSLFPYSIL